VPTLSGSCRLSIFAEKFHGFSCRGIVLLSGSFVAAFGKSRTLCARLLPSSGRTHTLVAPRTAQQRALWDSHLDMQTSLCSAPKYSDQAKNEIQSSRP
jgi:hypothetical protein